MSDENVIDCFVFYFSVPFHVGVSKIIRILFTLNYSIKKYPFAILFVPLESDMSYIIISTTVRN